MSDDDYDDPPAANNIGLVLAILWFFAGVLGCAGAGAVAALMSESLGVLASYFGYPLFVGGLAALLIAPFVRRSGAGVAVGAPVGCGCLGMIATFFLVVVFFAVIFPAL